VAVTAVVPVFAWLWWSWVTYASFLPNTFAAKRNLDIPFGEVIHQGAFYLMFSFRWDVGTFLVITLGLVAGLLRRGITRWWVAGVTLYLVYVVANGGDFMAGRFLAVPAYLCVFLIVCREDVWASVATVAYRWFGDQTSKVKAIALGALCVLVLFISVGLSLGKGVPTSVVAPHDQRRDFQNATYSRGIADERAVWVSWAHRSLENLFDPITTPANSPLTLKDADVTAHLSSISRLADDWPVRGYGDRVPVSVEAVGAVIGTWGIEMGPKFHIVDTSALTDRFLAEHPFVGRDYDWRIGHFGRAIPDGYLEAIRRDNPDLLADPTDARHLKDLWSRIKSSSED